MGQSLSAPITNQHIHRHNTDLFRAAGIHLQGWRANQEDAANMCTINAEKSILLFGVYDGHGGALASEYLEEEAPGVFAEISSLEEDNWDNITNLILRLDAQFLARQHEDGTTACFVFVQVWDTEANAPFVPTGPITYEQREKIEYRILAANVGDSRAIIIHPHDYTSTNNWEKLTDDHKPSDPVERQRIVAAGGHVQNDRVDGNLALSRAIGDKQYKSTPGLPVEKQKVIAIPDYTTYTAKYGDILFVACDGIFESEPLMTREQVASYISSKVSELQQNVLFELRSNTEVFNELLKITGKAEDELALEIEEYEQLPEVIKKYIDTVWDPSLISRFLIERSLCAGSKDNHTAITISFAPLLESQEDDDVIAKFFKAHMNTLLNLPFHDVVPGALINPQQNFVETYDADLLKDQYSVTEHAVRTPELEAQIAEISRLVEEYIERYGDDLPTDPESVSQYPSLAPYPIDWSASKEILPFPPIALAAAQRGNDDMGGFPPQLLNMLFQQFSADANGGMGGL